MNAILLPALFAVAFVAACYGWGRLVDARTPEPAGGTEPAALGLATLVAFGGILNLAGAVRPSVIAVLLLAGWISAAGSLVRARARPAVRFLGAIVRTRTGASLLALVLVVVALRLVAAGLSRSFSPYDDFPAYFVFPTRMAETGSIGVDPFSSRRSLSALGATYFLDAIVLTLFDHRSLNLMDKGVGLLLLGGSLLGYLRDRRCPPALAAIPLALLALVPPLRSNVTSLLLSSALFLALVRRLGAQPTAALPPSETFRIGLLGAALCALKSTMIPFAVLLIGLWYAQGIREAPGPVLRGAGRTASSALAALFPWMLSMQASAGTLLYPVLGRGHYGFPPVESVSLPAILATVAVGLAPLALLVPFEALAARANDIVSFRRAGRAALGAAGLGTITLVAGTTGMGFLRQPFPVLFVVALLVVATSLARLRDETRPEVRRALAAALLLVGLVAVVGAVHRHRLYAIWPRDVAFALSGRALERPEERDVVRAMQAAVPAGMPILAYVPRPYLFDFGRNPVYIADYPGAFAPPPGLPLDDSPERLREYLLARGIAHVAFTLEPHPKLETEEQYPWMDLAIRHQRAFEEALVALGRRCRKPVEVGPTFLVALSSCRTVEGSEVRGKTPISRLWRGAAAG